MKQIEVTAAVYITEIPVRLMRRHGLGDVAGSGKNAILKLETDAGVTGTIEAKSAMEMALFDIVGPACGLPEAGLLGGRCRDDSPSSFSVAGPDCDRAMAN